MSPRAPVESFCNAEVLLDSVSGLYNIGGCTALSIAKKHKKAHTHTSAAVLTIMDYHDPPPAPVGDGIVPCAHCGKRDSHKKRCSRCLSVVYCGRECQVAHWKAHKKACKAASKQNLGGAGGSGSANPRVTGDKPRGGQFYGGPRNLFTALTAPINNTPLEEAAKSGNAKLVARLLEQGADPFEQDQFLGWRPINMAIMAGHLEVVKVMVRKYPDLVHCRDLRQMTPLHAAACCHTEAHTEMVVEFLRHGADVDCKDEDGKTPLDVARERDAPSTTLDVLEEVVRRVNAEKSAGGK